MNNYSDDCGKRLKELIHKQSFKERDKPFTLKSGKQSRVYFDLRPVLLQPSGLDLVARAMMDLIEDIEEESDGLGHDDDEFEAVAGVLDGGASLATAFSMYAWDQHGVEGPILLVRKQSKDHGVGGMVMGVENVPKGRNVLVMEDVATTGGSALRAATLLREHGYKVTHCLAVLDRQEGAEDALADAGIVLRSLFTKSQFTDLT